MSCICHHTTTCRAVTVETSPPQRDGAQRNARQRSLQISKDKKVYQAFPRCGQTPVVVQILPRHLDPQSPPRIFLSIASLEHFPINPSIQYGIGCPNRTKCHFDVCCSVQKRQAHQMGRFSTTHVGTAASNMVSKAAHSHWVASVCVARISDFNIKPSQSARNPNDRCRLFAGAHRYTATNS